MSDLRGDHQGDCGLAIESRSWGYPGDSGHVIRVQGLGGGVTLETVDI